MSLYTFFNSGTWEGYFSGSEIVDNSGPANIPAGYTLTKSNLQAFAGSSSGQLAYTSAGNTTLPKRLLQLNLATRNGVSDNFTAGRNFGFINGKTYEVKL